MSLTCIVEANGKYFFGKTDNPSDFYEKCTKVKSKKIVFVDQCDFTTKYGEYCIKYGATNCLYDKSEKVERKGVENFGKKWTPEEKTGVLSDYKNKMNVRDIATKYKRSVGAIVSELHSNIPKSSEIFPKPTKKGDKWSNDENSLLIKLYEENYTILDIVNQLGRSKSSIECHLINMGLFKL